MRKYWGFYILNLKILWDEKITFIWTIILPLIIAVTGRYSLIVENSVSNFTEYLIWFWVYIILSTFINGLGLQIARLREQSLLKTYTLLAGGKNPIIIPIMFVQLTLCGVSLIIFTTIMLIIFQLTTIKLIILPLIGLLIIFIPVSLICMIIPTLPFRTSGTNTIFNIMMFPVFYLALSTSSKVDSNSFLYLLNPFQLLHYLFELIANPVQYYNFKNVFVLCFYLTLYIILGLLAYKKVNLVSTIQR